MNIHGLLNQKKGKDNPYRNYYHWVPSHDGKAPNQWRACFGGPAWVKFFIFAFTFI